MPRPRAPTRELFECTNRRRAGGKCDLYRCKRCGREMLENTHRFAIHIRICKEATDEDRATALGQLSKTKKYSMKVHRKPDTDLDKFMQHPEVSKTISEHLASLVALSAQETFHAGSSSTKNHHDHYSTQQHYGLDDHVNFAAPIWDAQTKTSCLPKLEIEDAYQYPSSMVFASSEVVSDNYFHSYSHYAPPPSIVYSAATATAAPDDVLARETARCRISDSHHNLDSPDTSTTTFYDDDMFQLLEPMTQYLRHDCYQTPADANSRHHQQQQQQHASSRHVLYSPSFELHAPPHDPQPCTF